MVNKKRIRTRNSNPYAGGPVLYWMGRDHRVRDNWGLLAAQAIATANQVPLMVVFTLVPTYLGASIRQYGFMLGGFEDVESGLRELNIPFYLPIGEPDAIILDMVQQYGIGAIVTDFLPLNVIDHWKGAVAEKVDIPFYEVDAHNLVPAWVASPKQEVGAYTLRPKLRRLWPEYLEDFPAMAKQSHAWEHLCPAIDWAGVRKAIAVSQDIKEITWAKPGEAAAGKALDAFLNERLTGYAQKRNLPGQAGTSELSPYLHYGHVAPQRVALAVQASAAPEADKEAFLEELLVRRELSDNFCLYNKEYDRLAGAPAWAQESHRLHRGDPREVTYSRDELEAGATHDTLWNAAQREMLRRGKMHGYMRMYWAKKILEWTATPEEALAITLYLNDTYFVDGRDPNGYVGALWSIGGLHDRPWFERPVFGKIRYMNRNGAERKFDVQAYIDYVDGLGG